MKIIIAELLQKQSSKNIRFSFSSKYDNILTEENVFAWIFINVYHMFLTGKMQIDQKIYAEIVIEGKIQNYLFRKTTTDYLNFIRIEGHKFIIEKDISCGEYSSEMKRTDITKLINYIPSAPGLL